MTQAAPPQYVWVTYGVPASQPDTSSDELLARALAEEEAAEAAARQAQEQTASTGPPQDNQLALSLHDREVEELCRAHSAQLSVLPQLIPESPLARTLSNALPSSSFSKFVPQVNEFRQLPSSVPSDRQRLELRLGMYGLVERQVKGDGACQFRSLSDQLYRTPRLHAFVRECVVRQLQQHPEQYQAFVPDNYESYCTAMAKPATWGDHVTLKAAADYFGLKVCLVTSFASSCFLEIEPQQALSQRTLWLSFWAEVHYNSVYPTSDAPGPLPDEKLLGSRKLYNLVYGVPSTAKGEWNEAAQRLPI